MLSLSIGEYIRQMRRQKGQTQTELGASQFSKSYISAVERGQIVPSRDALHFFAEQLDQSVESLQLLLKQSQKPTSLAPTPMIGFESSPSNADAYNEQEVVALLDAILQDKRSNALSGADYPSVPLDPALLLALQKHARYAVLNGIHVQENADFSTSQSALEYALALAPGEYKPAVLDALGTNAYRVQAYEQALTYYIRAHDSLKTTETMSTDLLFEIELHCGHAYRMLGYHEHAQEHYEHARKQLRSTHNMQIAAQLYLGLGYSTYADLYQACDATCSPEEGERQFQQALGFLLQSRTLSQVSSDWRGEIQARSMQAMVLLDLCAWRLRHALQKQQKQRNPIFVNCTSLFDEIHEQCQQVLLGIIEKYYAFEALPAEQESTVYLALAYMARALSRRATIARLGGYKDTAARESSLAYTLCQHILQSLQQPILSLTLIHDAINISGHYATGAVASILALPDLSYAELANKYSPFIIAELYFTLGEVSEEVAYASVSPDFVQSSYAVADQCFSQALNFDIKRSHMFATEYDPSYLVRLYQRYTRILERRLSTAIPGEETAERALTLLKDVLLRLPKVTLAFLPALQ